MNQPTSPQNVLPLGPSSFVGWYTGATQTGKTTKAIEDLKSTMASRRRPAIILDLARAKQFEDDYHELHLEHVLETVWRRGESVVYTPPDEASLEKLIGVTQEAKDVCILVDEANRVLSAKGYCSKALLGLIRTHAHARVYVFLTTQHFSGDIPAEARECAHAVFCFRTEGPRSIDLIEREYATPAKEIVCLETGQWVELLSRRRNNLRSLAGDPGT